MALDDLGHVEAIAIIRRLRDEPADAEAKLAATAFLRKYHPAPEVYLAALHASGESGEVVEVPGG